MANTSSFCIHLNKRNECPNHVCNPAITAKTGQERQVYELCKQITQYFEDDEFRLEMERRASLETDGNVTWFEAMMGALGTEATRLSIN